MNVITSDSHLSLYSPQKNRRHKSGKKMIENMIELFLQEGEGYKVEFKESIKELDREMCAFANAAGGTIILGVTDRGEKKGIDITNKLKSQIQDIAANCAPRINIHLEQCGNILLVQIPEGKNKPYSCSRGFYLRIGPNSQKMNRDEIMQFSIDEGIVRFDEIINQKFSFADFDSDRFNIFLKKANITVKLPQEELLVNLGLAEKSAGEIFFKNIASLMFSKELKKFHPQAFTTCLLYAGDSRSNIIDRKDFYGSLIEQVELAIQFVERNTLLAYQIKGLKRTEVPQYPINAIREAIINAIAHRDYFEQGSNVFVHVYQNFIEVINPGGLFKMKPEDFGRVSSRRNERISDLFRIIGWMERAGTGIKRMEDAMVHSGLRKPEFDFSENFFYVTFSGRTRDELGQISNGASIIKLNERQKKALDLISKQEKITTSEYMLLTNAEKRTAIRDLNELIKMNLLAIKGPKTGKGRYYIFVGDKGDIR